MRPQCPICKRKLVPPRGPADASILLIGEYPGYHEIQSGLPWVGKGGAVLAKELMRVGISLDQCRITNLWQHAKVKDLTELNWHAGEMVKELRGRKAVLLMGSDVTDILLGVSSMEVSGTEVESDYFPSTIKVAMAVLNPAIVLHDSMPIGEVRLALEKFGERVRSIE